MPETKFKIFGENTTNIYNDEDYSASEGDSTQSGRLNGAQPNTLISSKLFNTVLRGNSLAVKALMDTISATNLIGPNSNLNDVVAAINEGLKSFISKNSPSSKIEITQSEKDGKTSLKFVVTNDGVTQTIEVDDILAENAITSNNIKGGTQGSILYQNGANKTSFLSSPVDTSGEEYVLTTRYNGSTYSLEWKKNQNISVTENSDGTVDITIKNV